VNKLYQKSVSKLCQSCICSLQDKLIPAFDPMMAANRRPSPVLVPILSDEWEIPRDELKVFDKEPLGKGCFGEVHKGILAGQTTKRSVLGTTRSSRFSLACTVAVKKLKSKNYCVLMLWHTYYSVYLVV